MPRFRFTAVALFFVGVPGLGFKLSAGPVEGQKTFVGSVACQTCHPQIYSRWKTTRMANVVRDPRVDEQAILPDLSKPDPLVTFTKNDIAFVYGSRWKQRYFKKDRR